jgi:hypothetical protein
VKSPKKLALSGLLALAVLLATLFLITFSSSNSDWEKVREIATRVESGLRHEGLIALRSKVADLDAAVMTYTRHRPNRSEEQRVRSIKQAVDALEWSIDHPNADFIWDGTNEFEFYSTRQYLNAEPTCEESSGKLYISGRVLSSVCLDYAQRALLQPERPSALLQHDLNAFRTECISKYENQKRSAEQAEAGRAAELKQAEARRIAELRTRCTPFAGGSTEKVLAKTMSLPPKECTEVLGWMRDGRVSELYTQTQ